MELQNATNTKAPEPARELPPLLAVLKRQMFRDLDHLERKYGRVAVIEMLERWKTTQ